VQPDAVSAFEQPLETPEPVQEPAIAHEEEPKLQSEETKEIEQSPISEKDAILFLDVNLGKGESARIVVYKGDEAEDVIDTFGNEHNLNEKKRAKLLEVLKSQLSQIKRKPDLAEIKENASEEADAQ